MCLAQFLDILSLLIRVVEVRLPGMLRAIRLGKKGKRPDAPLDAKQDTLLLKDYPAAYNMAKAICQACPELGDDNVHYLGGQDERLIDHGDKYSGHIELDILSSPNSSESTRE
jgi:hypothetical protein